MESGGGRCGTVYEVSVGKRDGGVGMWKSVGEVRVRECVG